MRFNNINWELGRSFFLSPNLVSRLHIGLRTSWQSHKIVQKDFAIALAEVSAVPEDVIVINSSVSTYNQSYWGMGIRAGLGTSWMFTRNWSLFGNMALSPVWSKFKLKKRWQDDLTIDLTGEYSDIVSRDTLFIDPAVVFHKIDMVYEFQLGLRFDYFFNDSDYRLRVEAAWEEQYWAGLGEILQGINGNLSEPYGLTMQRLTVKVGFDF